MKNNVFLSRFDANIAEIMRWTSSSRWAILERNVTKRIGIAMDSVRLSQQLQDFFRTEAKDLAGGFESMTRLLEVFGKFLYGLSMPGYWNLVEIVRGDHAWHFPWRSQSDQASCPVCHTVSRHSAKR